MPPYWQILVAVGGECHALRCSQSSILDEFAVNLVPIHFVKSETDVPSDPLNGEYSPVQQRCGKVDPRYMLDVLPQGSKDPFFVVGLFSVMFFPLTQLLDSSSARTCNGPQLHALLRV